MITVRRAYFLSITGLLVLGTIGAVTGSETIFGLLLVSLPVEAVAAVISILYLWRVYSLGGRSSWVFRMLVEASGVKVIAGVYVGILAGLFLLGFNIPRDVTAPFSLIAANLLLVGVIYYAATIAERRHRTGRPPPLQDDD